MKRRISAFSAVSYLVVSGLILILLLLSVIDLEKASVTRMERTVQQEVTASL